MENATNNAADRDEEIAAGKHDDLREQAFLMQGTIADVGKRAVTGTDTVSPS